MEHTTCVWPGCRKAPEDADLPICDKHATGVHRHMERRVSTETRPRYTISRPSNPAGVVYYLRVGELVKVGFSSNLLNRLMTYPPHAELLATEPGTKALERQRHHELRHSLQRGREWFVQSDEVLDHVRSVVADHGEPLVVRPKGQRQRDRSALYPVTVTRIDA